MTDAGGRWGMWGLFLASLIVGGLVGLVGAGFQLAVRWAIEARAALAGLVQDVTVLRWAVPAVLSAAMVWLAYLLVRKIAPETRGSGVQEIEGALEGVRPTRWKRVLPVKFASGVLALGAGMVTGREGPTIQMGGNLGRMIADGLRLGGDKVHALIAAGAAGGLSAAFNAPLAGIVFVVEEMRPEFRYSFVSVTGVAIASAASAIALRAVMGQEASLAMVTYGVAPLASLWMFVVIGAVFGAIGVAFNHSLIGSMNLFDRLKGRALALSGLWVGAIIGLLTWLAPDMTGGGYAVMPRALNGEIGLWVLLAVFVGRFATTMFSYGSGVPGGIFAPMLALGTVFGLWFGHFAQAWFPHWAPHPGIFAVAGMGALFAATVRAPLTGIILVIEMTANYTLILPLIVTCLTATVVAHALGGRPIYTVLLERTLARSLAADQEGNTGPTPPLQRDPVK